MCHLRRIYIKQVITARCEDFWFEKQEEFWRNDRFYAANQQFSVTKLARISKNRGKCSVLKRLYQVRGPGVEIAPASGSWRGSWPKSRPKGSVNGPGKVDWAMGESMDKIVKSLAFLLRVW
jgi:hypothetical protein